MLSTFVCRYQIRKTDPCCTRIEPPPPALGPIFASLLKVGRLFLRYLALPRPNFMRLYVFTEKTNEHGRNFVLTYEGAPFYVRPTIWNR